MTRPRTATRDLVLAALVAALLAAVSVVQIPLRPVPVTLQTFVVVLAALVLRPSAAFAALTSYLLLGAIGLPVFSGGQGGPAVLAGPTGGYLWGFLLAAVAGSLTRVMLRRFRPAIADPAAALVVLACVYAPGLLQLSVVAGLSAPAAFAAGAAPFLVADVIKAAAAVTAAAALRRTAPQIVAEGAGAGA